MHVEDHLGYISFETPKVKAVSTCKTRPDAQGQRLDTWCAVRQSDAPHLQAMAQADRLWLEQLAGAPIRWPQTGHGHYVWDVDVEPQQPHPAVDAIITTQKHFPLAILTADCVPVVIFSLEEPGLAVVHAGWKGLACGVIGAAVQRLQQKGCHSLEAWIGPAVYPQQYQVGIELYTIFSQLDPQFGAAYHADDASHGYLNIPRIAQIQLEQAGVQRVVQSGWCSHLHADRFFSHRRGGDRGRIATVAWLPTNKL